MRDVNRTKGLLDAFRESYKQVQSADKLTYDKKETKPKERKVTSSKYSSFLDKYENLEETVDTFNSLDLTYFFREKSNEAGCRYVISNMKRDMGIFKKLQDNYSKREICLMIEFIFSGEQNYLDIKVTQPTVLASNWCMTIFQDSLLWVEDKYVPRIKKTTKKETIKKREWQRVVKEEKTKIGEWE